MANLRTTGAIAGATESGQIGVVSEKRPLVAAETPEDAGPR
jgi:hypothetical protein